MVSFTESSLLFLVVTFMLSVSTSAQSQPHIIVVNINNLGWNDVGWNNPYAKTPNMDKLAGEGVILDNSYTSPSPGPSRVAFYTGQYPFLLGLQRSSFEALSPEGIPLKYPLLPEELQKLGYRTHLVGKWGLGYCDWAYTPTRRGYDSFLGFYFSNDNQWNHTKTSESGTAGLNLFYDEEPNTDYKEMFSVDMVTMAATKILSESNPLEPLFLYVGISALESPDDVPVDYEAMFSDVVNVNRRKFLGTVAAIDGALGEIMNSLDDNDFAENTILIVMSDEGAPLDPAIGGSNYPLRGGNSNLWDGGARIVNFVHGNLQKKGYVNHKLIHMVDWFPTLIHLAGGTADNHLSGVNQWEAISNNGAPSRTTLIYNIIETEVMRYAIRDETFKLIQEITGSQDCYTSSYYPNSVNEARPCETRDSPEFPIQKHLYNLLEDQSERKDLLETHQNASLMLQQELDKWATLLIPGPTQDLVDDRGDPRVMNNIFKAGWCSPAA